MQDLSALTRDWTPCPLHQVSIASSLNWSTKSQSLAHQGSPKKVFTVRLSIPLSLAFTGHSLLPMGLAWRIISGWALTCRHNWTLEGERWARPGRRGAGERGRPWGNPKQGGLRWAGNGIKLQSVLCSEQPWTSLLPSLSLNVLICKNHQLLSLLWKPHVVKDMITP